MNYSQRFTLYDKLSWVGKEPENPRVGGSIPPLATIIPKKFNRLEAVRRALRNFSYPP
jgi:hypothetical protein